MTVQNTKARVMAIAAGVILLGGAIGMTVAKAQSSDLSLKQMIAIVAGHEIAQKVDVSGNQLSSNDFSLNEEKIAGAAGDTYGTQKQASILITTTTESGINTVSSTLGAILNPTRANGGRLRRITRVEAFLDGTNGTIVGGSLIMDFGTSTSQYTSSSNPIASQALVTSTLPISASSTPTQMWKTLWAPGEYFQCKSNRAVSSTNGYCIAEYIILD